MQTLQSISDVVRVVESVETRLPNDLVEDNRERVRDLLRTAMLLLPADVGDSDRPQ
jgi:hypothetical protein